MEQEKVEKPAAIGEAGSRGIPKPFIRRKRLPLIDQKFQFKVTLLVGVFITVTHLFFGAYIYFHAAEYAQKIADSVPDLTADMQWFETHLLRYMFFPIITSFAAVVLLSIYFSARISGPLLNMTRVLQAVTKGEFSRRIRLRKGDELQEFSETANALFQSLEDREGRLQDLLHKIQTHIQGKVPQDRKLGDLVKQAQECGFEPKS